MSLKKYKKEEAIKKLKAKFDYYSNKLTNLLGYLNLKKSLLFFSILYLKFQPFEIKKWKFKICDQLISIYSYLYHLKKIEHMPKVNQIRRIFWHSDDFCLFLLELISKRVNINNGNVINYDNALNILDFVTNMFFFNFREKMLENQDQFEIYIFETRYDTIYLDVHKKSLLDSFYGRVDDFRIRPLEPFNSYKINEYFKKIYKEYLIFDDEDAFNKEYGYSVKELVWICLFLTIITIKRFESSLKYIRKLERKIKHNLFDAPNLDLENLAQKLSDEGIYKMGPIQDLLANFYLSTIYKDCKLIEKVIRLKSLENLFINREDLIKILIKETKFEKRIVEKILNRLILFRNMPQLIGFLNLYQRPLLELENNELMLIPGLFFNACNEILDELISKNGNIGRIKGDFLQNKVEEIVKKRGGKIIHRKRQFFNEEGKIKCEIDLIIDEGSILKVIELRMDSFTAWDTDQMYNLPVKEKKYIKWAEKIMKKTQDIKTSPKDYGIDISKYKKIIPMLITDKPIYINKERIPPEVVVLDWEEFYKGCDLQAQTIE